MRRRYGKDVYFFNILQLGTLGFALVILLKKLHDGTMIVDATTIATITALSIGINNAYTNIRLQWQANGAHQRVTKLRNDSGL